MERLDRTLCNLSRRESFGNAQLIVLEPLGYDHSPLLLFPKFVGCHTKKSFKFELMWPEHSDLNNIIKSNWLPCAGSNGDIAACFLKNLERVKKALLKWSKIEFPNNRKTLNDLLA